MEGFISAIESTSTDVEDLYIVEKDTKKAHDAAMELYHICRSADFEVRNVEPLYSKIIIGLTGYCFCEY